MKKSQHYTAILLCLLLLSACSSANQNQQADTSAVTAQSSQKTESQYPDKLPDNLDFNGETVTFYSSFEGNFETESSGDIVNNVIYERNLKVSERLNVVLKEIPVGETPWTEMPQTLMNEVQSGDCTFDVITAKRWYISENALTAGAVMNLLDLPAIDFSASYWDQTMLQNTMYHDNCYWATGDITYQYLASLQGIFVNKNLLTTYHPDANLYQDVLENRWTMEYFLSLIRGTYQDLNGNNTGDIGDLFGFEFHDTNVNEILSGGMMLTFTENDKNGVPTYSFDLNRLAAIGDYLQTLKTGMTESLWDDESIMPGNDISHIQHPEWESGNVMFLASTFNNTFMRNVDFSFMILPLPKFNEAQAQYSCLMSDSVPILGVISTISEDRYAIVGSVLEALASHGAQDVSPVYYETALKIKYAQDTDSGKMIDIIRNGYYTDFNMFYNVNGLQYLIRRNTGAFENGTVASLMEGLEQQTEAALADLLETLDSLE